MLNKKYLIRKWRFLKHLDEKHEVLFEIFSWLITLFYIFITLGIYLAILFWWIYIAISGDYIQYYKSVPIGLLLFFATVHLEHWYFLFRMIMVFICMIVGSFLRILIVYQDKIQQQFVFNYRKETRILFFTILMISVNFIFISLAIWVLSGNYWSIRKLKSTISDNQNKQEIINKLLDNPPNDIECTIYNFMCKKKLFFSILSIRSLLIFLSLITLLVLNLRIYFLYNQYFKKNILPITILIIYSDSTILGFSFLVTLSKKMSLLSVNFMCLINRIIFISFMFYNWYLGYCIVYILLLGFISMIIFLNKLSTNPNIFKRPICFIPLTMIIFILVIFLIFSNKIPTDKIPINGSNYETKMVGMVTLCLSIGFICLAFGLSPFALDTIELYACFQFIKLKTTFVLLGLISWIAIGIVIQVYTDSPVVWIALLIISINGVLLITFLHLWKLNQYKISYDKPENPGVNITGNKDNLEFMNNQIYEIQRKGEQKPQNNQNNNNVRSSKEENLNRSKKDQEYNNNVRSSKEENLNKSKKKITNLINLKDIEYNHFLPNIELEQIIDSNEYIGESIYSWFNLRILLILLLSILNCVLLALSYSFYFHFQVYFHYLMQLSYLFVIFVPIYKYFQTLQDWQIREIIVMIFMMIFNTILTCWGFGEIQLPYRLLHSFINLVLPILTLQYILRTYIIHKKSQNSLFIFGGFSIYITFLGLAISIYFLYLNQFWTWFGLVIFILTIVYFQFMFLELWSLFKKSRIQFKIFLLAILLHVIIVLIAAIFSTNHILSSFSTLYLLLNFLLIIYCGYHLYLKQCQKYIYPRFYSPHGNKVQKYNPFSHQMEQDDNVLDLWIMSWFFIYCYGLLIDVIFVSTYWSVSVTIFSSLILFLTIFYYYVSYQSRLLGSFKIIERVLKYCWQNLSQRYDKIIAVLPNQDDTEHKKSFQYFLNMKQYCLLCYLFDCNIAIENNQDLQQDEQWKKQQIKQKLIILQMQILIKHHNLQRRKMYNLINFVKDKSLQLNNDHGILINCNGSMKNIQQTFLDIYENYQELQSTHKRFFQDKYFYWMQNKLNYQKSIQINNSHQIDNYQLSIEQYQKNCSDWLFKIIHQNVSEKNVEFQMSPTRNQEINQENNRTKIRILDTKNVNGHKLIQLNMKAQEYCFQPTYYLDPKSLQVTKDIQKLLQLSQQNLWLQFDTFVYDYRFNKLEIKSQISRNLSIEKKINNQNEFQYNEKLKISKCTFIKIKFISDLQFSVIIHQTNNQIFRQFKPCDIYDCFRNQINVKQTKFLLVADQYPAQFNLMISSRELQKKKNDQPTKVLKIEADIYWNQQQVRKI